MSIADEIAEVRGTGAEPLIKTGADGRLIEREPELEMVETDDQGQPIEARRPAVDKAEGDAAEGDERLDAEGADEAEPKTDKERNRQRERRRRRQQARARENQEVTELRNQVAQLNEHVGRLTHGQVAGGIETVDARLGDAVRAFRSAEEDIKTAVKTGDGDGVVDAMRRRDQAYSAAVQLERRKEQLSRAPQQQQRQPEQAPPLDPVMVRHANDFMADASWYNPKGSDEDSLVTLAIDHSLMQEGFDPRSPDYWDELRERVAKRLPHRKFKDAAMDQDDDRGQDAADEAPRSAPRRSPATTIAERARPRSSGPPVAGSGRSAQPGAGRVYISPERKAAMIEAGAWEDPEKRQRLLKRYAEHDRLNGATR